MQQRRAGRFAAIAPGETVYLLAEMPAGGRIHEIGSRALVLEAEGDELTLAVGASEPALVSCPAAHVVCSRQRRARRRFASA